jgi:hypothetical protein
MRMLADGNTVAQLYDNGACVAIIQPKASMKFGDDNPFQHTSDIGEEIIVNIVAALNYTETIPNLIQAVKNKCSNCGSCDVSIEWETCEDGFEFRKIVCSNCGVYLKSTPIDNDALIKTWREGKFYNPISSKYIDPDVEEEE